MNPENENIPNFRPLDTDDTASNSQSKPSPPKEEKVEEALQQAEHDIELDPEFSAHSPNDDLDEGETARLGEDMSDIV